MRDIRSGNCPLCDHHEIVEASPPEYGHQGFEVAAAVTADPRWVLGGRNPEHGHGELRAYFCRACGFTQWFVLDPESVPLGEGYRTTLIEGRPAGEPYR